MNLNKENIEESIFNYLEGNLSGNELTAFKSYINTNADAKAELDLWKQTYVGNSTSTISSAEFSSLKKSNNMYYWAGGVATAFLLGIGTMAVVSNNTIEQSQPQLEAEEIQTTTPKEIVKEEVIQPFAEEMGSDEESIEIVGSVEPEIIQEENIEMSKQLDVNLEPSETNREAKLKAIKIKKESIVKKKKEVDVIDIETGF